MEGPEKRDPVRIIVDSRLRIPMESRLVKTAGQQPVILAALADQVRTCPDKQAALEEAGVKVLALPDKNGRVDLQELMRVLGEEEKIDGILLEGGGILNESMLQEGLVGKVYCYVAPKIFGGEKAKTPVEGCGKDLAADAWLFKRTRMQELGEDLLIEYKRI